jgi:hypothetical protein
VPELLEHLLGGHALLGQRARLGLGGEDRLGARQDLVDPIVLDDDDAVVSPRTKSPGRTITGDPYAARTTTGTSVSVTRQRPRPCSGVVKRA